MTIVRSVTWSLPEWMFGELDLESPRTTTEEKMGLAIEVARRNVEHGGGPFGAVIFEMETGRVVAPGANLVVPQGSSLLHAEMVAMMFAQAQVGSFTLSGGHYELVTSSEPCVQCLGAVYWAGLERMTCGALLADAEVAGFDEGPRAENWKEQLLARGITVRDRVLATEARQVLLDYQARGGVVYNASTGG